MTIFPSLLLPTGYRNCHAVMEAIKRGAKAAELLRLVKGQMKIVEAVASIISRGGTCDC